MSPEWSPESIRSTVVVVSDRVLSGEKEDKAGPAEQIRAYGLAKTPLASLSRGVVGVSARNRTGALIVVSPGSSGGAQDTLDVVEPLVPHILAQLDEA